MATHSRILAWRIPMDRGAWGAIVHGVIKSWTRLTHHHFHTGLNSPVALEAQMPLVTLVRPGLAEK